MNKFNIGDLVRHRASKDVGIVAEVTPNEGERLGYTYEVVTDFGRAFTGIREEFLEKPVTFPRSSSEANQTPSV